MRYSHFGVDMTSFKSFVAVLMLLSLQGCCIWGYTTTSEYVWQSSDAGVAVESENHEYQVRACRASAIKTCTDEYREVCRRFPNGKGSVTFGLPDECAAMQTDSKLVPKACLGGSVSECMEKNGFQLVKREVLSCSSMKFF